MEITAIELEEYDAICEEAEGVFFAKHDIDLMLYMPEEEHARYRELYRKIHGFCPDGECKAKECENCGDQ